MTNPATSVEHFQAGYAQAFEHARSGKPLLLTATLQAARIAAHEANEADADVAAFARGYLEAAQAIEATGWSKEAVDGFYEEIHG